MEQMLKKQSISVKDIPNDKRYEFDAPKFYNFTKQTNNTNKYKKPNLSENEIDSWFLVDHSNKDIINTTKDKRNTLNRLSINLEKSNKFQKRKVKL
jgi:hypothetical protein